MRQRDRAPVEACFETTNSHVIGREGDGLSVESRSCLKNEHNLSLPRLVNQSVVLAICEAHLHHPAYRERITVNGRVPPFVGIGPRGKEVK